MCRSSGSFPCTKMQTQWRDDAAGSIQGAASSFSKSLPEKASSYFLRLSTIAIKPPANCVPLRHTCPIEKNENRRTMESAHHITQKMENPAIEPESRASTLHTTTMKSTDRITQKMEDMALDPKARAVTPSASTTSTASYAPTVFSQLQSQFNLSSNTPTTSNTTGGYIHTTTPTGLAFSNPNASGSTTTTAIDSHQSQDQDLAAILMNCDDPMGLYKSSLYSSGLHRVRSQAHSHYRPMASRNRVTKSRSTPCLRKRYYQLSHQHIQAPFPSTIVHEARIEQLPGTTEIFITANDEEKEEEEKDRKTMMFFGECVRRTKERVAAEKAAEAASRRLRELQEENELGIGAFEGPFSSGRGETCTPSPKVKKTYVNQEGEVVEESWAMEMETPPIAISPVFLAGGNEDFARMDDVMDNYREEDTLKEKAWEQEDGLMSTTHTFEEMIEESNYNEGWGQWKRALAGQ